MRAKNRRGVSEKRSMQICGALKKFFGPKFNDKQFFGSRTQVGLILSELFFENLARIIFFTWATRSPRLSAPKKKLISGVAKGEPPFCWKSLFDRRTTKKKRFRYLIFRNSFGRKLKKFKKGKSRRKTLYLHLLLLLFIKERRRLQF